MRFGQVPALASPLGQQAFKYLIGSVLAGVGVAVVDSLLGGPDTEDSWLDRSVFNARMNAMHVGFLMVQCEVGGAQPNQSYGCDDNNRNCICVGGTQPKCLLPGGKRTEWRALRDGFYKFYDEVGGSSSIADWMVSDPTPAQVRQARNYAHSLVRFFIGLPSMCPGYVLPFDLESIVQPEEGTTAQQTAEIAADRLRTEDPAWVKGMKYAAFGLGAIALLWVGVQVKNAFDKR